MRLLVFLLCGCVHRDLQTEIKPRAQSQEFNGETAELSSRSVGIDREPPREIDVPRLNRPVTQNWLEVRGVCGQIRERVIHLRWYAIAICLAEDNRETTMLLELRGCRPARPPRLTLLPLTINSKRTAAQ